MRYRNLGSRGPSVSEIGFGTGDNAGLMVLGSERERQAAVDRALDLGITYFDTAPDYGKGRAESHLGIALRTRRSEAVVATKVDIVPETIDDIEATIMHSLDASLTRLQMDHVDVLMLHNPPRPQRDANVPGWTPLGLDDYHGPVRRALERAKAAGKARYFGFGTEHGDPECIKALLESGLFTVINARYSLVDADDAVIGIAHRAGAGVAVIRVLAGGALTSQAVRAGSAARHRLAGGSLSRNPAVFAQALERSRPFAGLETRDRTLQQAAYIFALMHPAVSTVLGGFSEIAHLEELVRTSGAAPLSSTDLRNVRNDHARTS
jgi:aryl-alcohol dehydrogenase-like predicted oxidoreductase